VADVEIGHHSTIVPHLGNFGFCTGHKIRWDAAKEEIIGDPEAPELVGRKSMQALGPDLIHHGADAIDGVEDFLH